MLTKKSSSYLLIAITLSLTLLGGCGSKTKEDPERSWFYEHEFDQDDTLYAKIHHTVILDISSEQQPDGSEEHAVRYEYDESGEHVFCIDRDEKYIQTMTLLDEYENVKLTLKKDDGCINVYLDAGRYSMQITHDASKVPESGTVAFIHHPANTALKSAEHLGVDVNASDETNTVYNAFEVSGGDYDGYYLGTKKEKLGIEWDFLGVFSPDSSSSFYERRHLFTLEEKDGKQVLKAYDWNSKYWKASCHDYPSFCVDSQNQSLYNSNMIFTSIEAADSIGFYFKSEANQTYTLWNEEVYILDESSLYAAENTLMYSTSTTKEPTDATLFRKIENIRLYEDGSTYTLKENEVAFSEACGMKGATYVIDGNLSDAVAWSLPQIKSIKFGGDDTNIIFFGKKDYQDWQATVVGMDEACLETPLSFPIGSIKILNAQKVFISSHQCNYCNLAGADLSDLNLSNVSLRYANLTNTQFNNTIMQKADMRYAKLYGANLSYSDLKGSTMCGAFLNGNDLSSGNSATLEGAYLKNVNLAHSNLNGADFYYANFHNVGSSGCIPSDCGYTSCSSAAQATLNSTNFSNAYLAGIDFSNSNMMETDFTNAVLTGAKFINTTIDRDPDTGHKTLFNGAFIQAADFQNAAVSGANFTNAYVDFSDNNSIFFLLRGGHSEFAGWTPYGERICKWFAYSNSTNIPVVDSYSICPDGSSGPCEDAVWTDPKTPMNKADVNASYFSDPNRVCNNPNIYW